MLPEKFKEKMEKILGNEAEQLFFEIENGKTVRSFRVNTAKISLDDFEASDPEIDRKKADFPPECYYTEEQFPGLLACHHAGMIYMQDPSAMATVHAVRVKNGMKILDSCSAPGGKTTQLAVLAGDDGVVVANEYDAKRCRILQGNVERMGVRNTVVVNLDTAVLANVYPNMFDLVLCDAPCSGEGMFRKNEHAVGEWSEQNVLMCAERQREILENVSKCVAEGGHLIYSTCTFSLEENEMNVDWFLRSHPDFELCDVEKELYDATSCGISDESFCADMKKTRRIYPHRSKGEGQFIALFKRLGESTEIAHGEKERAKKKKDIKVQKPSKDELDAIREAKLFLEENLNGIPEKKLLYHNGKVYLSPYTAIPEYGVFASGVCVGEIERGRFLPHHQLFSAYGNCFKRKILISSGDRRTKDYLKGLEIAADDAVYEGGKMSGWAAVIVDGVALGGGKISGGVCKNHYPKGLRNQN